MLLSVREVTLRFGGIVALDAVSFDVAQGTVSGLIGPGRSMILWSDSNCVARQIGVPQGTSAYHRWISVDPQAS